MNINSRFIKNSKEVSQVFIKLKDNIECIAAIYINRGSWFRYEFKINFYGNRKPFYIYSNTIKRYETVYKDILIPKRIFGITIGQKDKRICEEKELLTTEEFERIQEKEFSFLEMTRNNILELFNKNEREQIDREYEGCLESQHLWGEWNQYSGHKQKQCYKCGRKEGIGTVDGKPVTQTYIDNLSCGYH